MGDKGRISLKVYLKIKLSVSRLCGYLWMKLISSKVFVKYPSMVGFFFFLVQLWWKDYNKKRKSGSKKTATLNNICLIWTTGASFWRDFYKEGVVVRFFDNMSDYNKKENMSVLIWAPDSCLRTDLNNYKPSFKIMNCTVV